jgi:hypothetical protein
MRLSITPDLSAPRRVMVTAGVVALVVAVLLGTHLDVRARLGDTDDAMRLVMVRDLMSGQGWYHQSIARLAPPTGLYMHWSRLLDGGIAGLMAMLRLVYPPVTAEWLTRVLWPLAWIFPAVLSGLWLARSLGGRSAVLIAAVLMLMNLEIYRQFIPSRIDHHNVQIVMMLVSAACVTTPSRRPLWGAIGGGATALGLAVGLEAIAFHALIGCAWAMRLALDRRNASGAAAYGAALAATAVAAFLVQTPPWRWSLSVCDALGLNLVCALAVAGCGLAALASNRERLSGPALWTLVGLTGLVAGIVYLALGPACIHGPFAGVDVLARRLWLDGVEEVQPLTVVFKLSRTSAVDAVVILAMSLTATVFLLLWDLRPPVVYASILLCVAIVSACLVWRLLDYVFWMGLPMIAAAASRVTARRMADVLVPTIAATILLSPTSLAVAANTADRAIAPRASRGFPNTKTDPCFAPRAFDELGSLPRGVVLSEPDLGPYILAYTSHAAMVAPYHRLWRAIIVAHAALDASPAIAEGEVRSLGVGYVVDCAGLSLPVRAGSLGERLRAGVSPPWLQRVSTPGATLTIYEVRKA